jgi:serine/threonine protein kinase
MKIDLTNPGTKEQELLAQYLFQKNSPIIPGMQTDSLDEQVGLYYSDEKVEIFKRKSAHGNGYRYDVMSKRPISSGGYSFLYPILYTIKMWEENDPKNPESAPTKHYVFKTKPENKKRVVKKQRRDPTKHTESAFINARHAEFKTTARAGHLHIKEPVFFDNSSYTSMRSVGDMDLLEVINKDIAKWDEKKEALTLEQRLILSINFLKACEESILNKGLIHRDLKPDNVRVDENTLECFIIDYDFAKDINKRNVPENLGTALWVAPEAVVHKPPDATPGRDFFTESRILGGLWRDNLDKYTSDIPKGYKIAMQNDFSDVCQDLPDLKKSAKKYITAVISQMGQFDPAKRIELTQADLDNLGIPDFQLTTENLANLDMPEIGLPKLNLDSLETPPDMQTLALLNQTRLAMKKYQLFLIKAYNIQFPEKQFSSQESNETARIPSSISIHSLSSWMPSNEFLPPTEHDRNLNLESYSGEYTDAFHSEQTHPDEDFSEDESEMSKEPEELIVKRTPSVDQLVAARESEPPASSKPPSLTTSNPRKSFLGRLSAGFKKLDRSSGSSSDETSPKRKSRAHSPSPDPSDSGSPNNSPGRNNMSDLDSPKSGSSSDPNSPKHSASSTSNDTSPRGLKSFFLKLPPKISRGKDKEKEKEDTRVDTEGSRRLKQSSPKQK